MISRFPRSADNRARSAVYSYMPNVQKAHFICRTALDNFFHDVSWFKNGGLVTLLSGTATVEVPWFGAFSLLLCVASGWSTFLLTKVVFLNREPDVAGVPAATNFITDYRLCTWGEVTPGMGVPGALSVAEWFDVRNEGLWDESLRDGCDVISFAHFLPIPVRTPDKALTNIPTCFSCVSCDVTDGNDLFPSNPFA
jgi:hypothetical protein